MALNPDWDQKTVAEFLKLDPSMVTRLLSPGKCIAAVREAFEAGRLNLSGVYELSKQDAAGQELALPAALKGATREQLKQTRIRKRNGTAQSVRISRVKCPLGSGMTVMVSGPAVSLTEFVEALSEAQAKAKDALKRGLNAKSFQQVLADRAKAK